MSITIDMAVVSAEKVRSLTFALHIFSFTKLRFLRTLAALLGWYSRAGLL